MATDTYTFVLEWENNNKFKMTQQHAAGTAITIIECEENASIGGIWENIETICKSVFGGRLASIGDEMKS